MPSNRSGETDERFCDQFDCIKIIEGGADELAGKQRAQWIVTSSQSEVLKGDAVEVASQLTVGDVIKLPGLTEVFPIAGWKYDSDGKTESGRSYRILELNRDNLGTTWIKIRESSNGTAASTPSTSPPSTTIRNGIWWEMAVAEATGGYDAKDNRTLINSYDLAVYGPISVEAAASKVIEDCVSASGVASYEAFKDAPSPEIGVRIGAAWIAFKATIVGCFKINSIKDALVDQFDIGYIRRGRWVGGLNLLFSAENPSSEHFRNLHNIVKNKLPDPMNKMVTFFIAASDYPKVDIDLDPPQGVRDVIAQLPDPKELREMAGGAEKLMAKGGKHFEETVKAEAAAAAMRLGRDAAVSADKVPQVAIRLVGQAADDCLKAAPGFAKSLVPQMKDGKLIVGPITASVSGSPSITTPTIAEIPGCNLTYRCEGFSCGLRC